jgi:hypothetical protein
MKRIGRVAVIIALGLLVLSIAFTLIAPLGSPSRKWPPSAMTQQLLSSVAAACSMYYSECGEPPASLADLTNNVKGIVFIHWGKSGTNDFWGNPIRFQPYDASLGYGTVTSYGCDGRPGGTGRDADTEVRFGERRR